MRRGSLSFVRLKKFCWNKSELLRTGLALGSLARIELGCPVSLLPIVYTSLNTSRSTFPPFYFNTNYYTQSSRWKQLKIKIRPRLVNLYWVGCWCLCRRRVGLSSVHRCIESNTEWDPPHLHVGVWLGFLTRGAHTRGGIRHQPSYKSSQDLKISSLKIKTPNSQRSHELESLQAINQ